MIFNFRPPNLSRLRGIAKQAVLIAVILTVSGAPGYVVQGVAWWQMAERSGGLDQLSATIFEAAPCHLCCAARELNDSGDPESPGPSKRLQSFRLVATLTDSLSAPPAAIETQLSISSRARSDSPPGSRNDRPDTPPPRVGA